MTTHSFPLNRDEFDLVIDDKNGKSGSIRRGMKSSIEKTVFAVCKCKQKARFYITTCFHKCCGRCLKLATAFVSFENHESTEVFYCPVCKTEEKGVLSWIKQKDVYDQVFQRNICICCFQIKTFGVTKCNHGICYLCIRQLLENLDTEQYPCPWTGCDVTYDLTSLSEMYTDTLAEMSQKFFQRPSTTESSCCRNMAVLELKKRCLHTLCMDCADKAPLVNSSSENEENLQKCPLQRCSTKFPKECLDYSLQQLKSNMQMEDKLNSSNSDEASSSIAGDDNVGKQASVGKTDVESMHFTFKKLDPVKNGVRAKGLPNLGLTCYRNSVYQILAESPNFFSILQRSTNYFDEDWTFTLCEILWRILSKSSSKGITEWLYRLQQEFSVIDDSFREYGQYDSLSFLTSLLNGITEEIQRKKKILNQQSIEGHWNIEDPTNLYRGEMHDKYTCQNCKKEEYAGLSYFFSLPLPTIYAKTPKIGQCLHQFFEAETLKGVVNCPHCKHDTVSKETVIKTFPNILVLQLGMISEKQEKFTRVQKSPKFWENFKGLTNNIHLSKINMTELSKYTLFGVIVHIGGLSGGHYYSYVKRLENEKWDLCDDSYVKRVDLANVLCSDAYILFYHKCKRDTEC